MRQNHTETVLLIWSVTDISQVRPRSIFRLQETRRLSPHSPVRSSCWRSSHRRRWREQQARLLPISWRDALHRPFQSPIHRGRGTKTHARRCACRGLRRRESRSLCQRCGYATYRWDARMWRHPTWESTLAYLHRRDRHQESQDRRVSGRVTQGDDGGRRTHSAGKGQAYHRRQTFYRSSRDLWPTREERDHGSSGIEGR